LGACLPLNTFQPVAGTKRLRHTLLRRFMSMFVWLLLRLRARQCLVTRDGCVRQLLLLLPPAATGA
jgi:hypothetical protein